MSLDLYKVPRDQVDVEALAQEMARYLRITAEDAEFLSYDPARRDAIIAELYTQPGVKSSPWANQFVAEGQNPDDYLVPANTAIEELTPPKSLEDRAKRLHIAFAAMMVFNQYKIGYALLDHPDLDIEVLKRQTALMDDWYKNEYPRLFPDRAKNIPAVSTLPHRPNPLQAPPAPDRSAKPKVISMDDVSQFLNKPEMLLGKRFQHSPPQDQEQDYKGTWEMASYSVRMGEGGIEHEYEILLEALDGASLPMGREDVRFLLMHSTSVP